MSDLYRTWSSSNTCLKLLGSYLPSSPGSVQQFWTAKSQMYSKGKHPFCSACLFFPKHTLTLCVEEPASSPVATWKALTCYHFFICRAPQCESFRQPLWDEWYIWGNLSRCASGGISFLWRPVWHHDQSAGEGHGYPHGLEQSKRRGALPGCQYSHLWPQVRHLEASGSSSSLGQTVCRNQSLCWSLYRLWWHLYQA